MRAFDARHLAKKLVGPDGLAAFDAHIRETRTARFETALDAAEASSLFDVRRLERAIDDGAIAVGQIDIFVRGHIVRIADLAHRSGRTVLDIAAEQLGAGATLRVRDLQRADADLVAFGRAVQEAFSATAQINLYLTPPLRDGFPPHFDITDVLVVQVAGSKSWRIHSDYADQQRLPMSDTPWDPRRYIPTDAGEELTLRTGDVLYIPRGFMHSAVSLAEESMHLTISLAPMTYADLLTGVLARRAKKHEALRRRVPLQVQAGNDLRALAAGADALIDSMRSEVDFLAVIQAELARLAAPEAPEGTFSRALRQNLDDIE
jgi:hypothetical protein